MAESARLIRSAPFFAPSMVLGVVTIHFQVGSDVLAQGFASRLTGVACGLWFYLLKAVMPVNLSRTYPAWQIRDPVSIVAWLPTLALLGVAAGAWWKRSTWGRTVLFALGYFVVMLAPVVGILNMAILNYSLVADHLQYVGLIAPNALIVGLVAFYLNRLTVPAWLGQLALIGVLVIVSTLTWGRAQIFENSVALWRDTIQKNPNAWSHHRLGDALRSVNADDEAISHLQKALEMNPAMPRAHNSLALILQSQGNSETAISYFREATRLWPDFYRAHNNLGVLLEAQGAGPEAVASYRRALEINPEYAKAHYNLAVVSRTLGNVDMAMVHYRQALHYQPQNVDTLNSLGVLLASNSDIEAGVRQLTRAIRLKGDYAKAHHNLGSRYRSQGKISQAVTHYRDAIKYSPDSAEAHCMLGATLEQIGQMGPALQHLREPTRLKDDWAKPLDRLAWIMATTSDKNIRDLVEAVRLAERAATLTQRRVPLILDTLGAAYAADRQFEKAVHTGESVLAMMNTPETAPFRQEVEHRLELYELRKPFIAPKEIRPQSGG